MSLRDPTGFLWEEALELLDRAERMQRRFFRLQAVRERRPAWEPPIDVFERDDAIHVLVALPGVLPGQIEVSLEEGLLVVRGERALPAAALDAHIRRLEIPHGQFERRIALPSAGYRILGQALCDGCLGITLERLAGSSPP